MTKDDYFEMCEMLGSEPVEEEIPIDFSDMHTEVQEAMGIYQKLKDDWDGMSGTYMGKSYAGIGEILDILDVPVEDRKTVFNLIGIIDAHRSKAIADAKPKTKSTNSPPE